ncbi:pPIWI_RE_Y domain-containing protein [Kitasatospora mediocidica]|uniref:pPIWI_RE_Y domain-containing protein n=1 Tax=Kitasatospora mediocidica TaxID=58352 RepID=UPI00055C6151|nr:HU-CCDC81 and SPOR domain-containing protein [Kitasatospora mediocidica]
MSGLADVELLAAVARGVYDLATSQPSAFRLPYPPSIQLALDRVVLDALTRRVAAPHGVPELLSWCREREPQEWLVTPRAFLTAGARLIHPTAGEPTRTCAELASLGPHGVLEQEAESLMAKLADSCGTAARFAQCRDFLIHRPVVLRFDPVEMLRPSRAQAWRLVKDLYGPVPSHFPADGLVHRCSACGLLAKAATADGSWCEGGCAPDERKLEVSHQPGQTLVLPPALRLFVALPGRTEMEVRSRLDAQSGLLSAGLGVHQIPGPQGVLRAYQVHDREQPVPAALRAAEVAARLGGELEVVVPDGRAACPTYRRAFDEALPVSAQVRLWSVSEFTTHESSDGTWGSHA